jgi:hypothetical protein
MFASLFVSLRSSSGVWRAHDPSVHCTRIDLVSRHRTSDDGVAMQACSGDPSADSRSRTSRLSRAASKLPPMDMITLGLFLAAAFAGGLVSGVSGFAMDSSCLASGCTSSRLAKCVADRFARRTRWKP